MHYSNRTAFLNISLFFSEIFFVFFAYITSCFTVTVCSSTESMDQITNIILDSSWMVIFYIPLWILIMLALGMYNDTTFNYYDRILRFTLFASLVSGALDVVLINFIKESAIRNDIFLTFMITNLIFILIERYVHVLITKKRQTDDSKEVIVVGSPEVYEKFNYYLKKTSLKLKVRGYVSTDNAKCWDKHHIIGDVTDLGDILTHTIVDEVIFTISKNEILNIHDYLSICEEIGVTARVILDIFDFKYAKIHVSDIGTLPMITLHTVSLNSVQHLLKRIMDIIGAVVGVIISIPIGIVVAIAIKINSKGPIFFAQNRVGRNGRIFKFYKFRSMCVDAEQRKEELKADNEIACGMMFKIKEDPRITSVGKFLRKTSLDELPQFINVLKGDMSLVGTRPPTVDEVEKYDVRHWRRISIKPGITGLWQVSGRSSIIDFDDVVRLDTDYIDKWSVLLDIKIILKTLGVIFKRSGAY